MQLTKCKLCGRPFQSYGMPFCPSCNQSLEDQYKLVKEYLYDNPNAAIETVVEETGVPEKIILYYLREGRLQMANASGILRCEQCGASINSGRLCDKCMGKLESRIVQPMQAKMAREMEARRKAEWDAESAGRRMHTQHSERE